ncbi:MAG: hypothetical protein ACM3SY_11045 [Candidatus Omnitrophota bacterium]
MITRVSIGKKISVILLTCLCLWTCSKTNDGVIKTLPKPFPKKFEKISVKKIFSTDIILGGFCVPFSDGIFLYEVLDNQGTYIKLKSFDMNGQLRKESDIKRNEGPDGIFSMNHCFSQGDRLMFIDHNTYLKEINPYDLSIRTLEKISNKIDEYHTKFIFGRDTNADIDFNNNKTITSFETTDYFSLDYYIVSYKGNFEQLKVIHKVKKKMLKTWAAGFKNNYEHFIDYNNWARSPRNQAVDWKNGFIYFFADSEKPEISRINMKGNNLTTIRLGINSKNFKMDREKIDVWYGWAIGGMPKIPGIKRKYSRVYSETAPVLRDVDIFGDWLLITTGKRNWDTFENEVLVYRLPDLSYEGSFFIPTGDWPTDKYGNYFVTKRIIEKNDDYFTQYNCYQLVKK